MMSADTQILYSDLPQQDEWERKPKKGRIISIGPKSPPKASSSSSAFSRKSCFLTSVMLIFTCVVLVFLLMLGFGIYEHVEKTPNEIKVESFLEDQKDYWDQGGGNQGGALPSDQGENSNQDDGNQDDGNQGDGNQGDGNQDDGNQNKSNQGSTPSPPAVPQVQDYDPHSPDEHRTHGPNDDQADHEHSLIINHNNQTTILLPTSNATTTTQPPITTNTTTPTTTTTTTPTTTTTTTEKTTTTTTTTTTPTTTTTTPTPTTTTTTTTTTPKSTTTTTPTTTTSTTSTTELPPTIRTITTTQRNQAVVVQMQNQTNQITYTIVNATTHEMDSDLEPENDILLSQNDTQTMQDVIYEYTSQSYNGTGWMDRSFNDWISALTSDPSAEMIGVATGIILAGISLLLIAIVCLVKKSRGMRRRRHMVDKEITDLDKREKVILLTDDVSEDEFVQA